MVGDAGSLPRTAVAPGLIEPKSVVARGRSPSYKHRAPVTFGDMATIRFTSGTSGREKGPCFDHANLRRMAESVPIVMNP
jgi:long-subunit acyl-CoA synthetase (AMP-forming)